MRRHAGIGFFSIQIIELADMTGTRKAHDKYSRLHGCRRPAGRFFARRGAISRIMTNLLK